VLGLGDLPGDQTVAIYAKLLRGAANADEQKLVLAGLANVPHPGALELVQPMLDQAAVRAEAEQAMLGIAGAIAGSAPDRARQAAATLRERSKNETVRRQAGQIIRQLERLGDYITAWQVAGPYTKGDPFRTAFAPEKDAEGVKWKLLSISSGERPWTMDLAKAVGGANRAAYVRTWVYSDADQPARIEFGTDDGHKLWLNSQLVHADAKGGSARPAEYKVNARLGKGWNALLLKVTRRTGHWKFCLRIRRPDGSQLPGLRAQAVPPEE